MLPAFIIEPMTGPFTRASFAFSLAGEALSALPDHALFWPRTRSLIVADVHLGKAAAFRRAGVPVPSGATAADLARLDALIAEHQPQRLLVLGDLFHARLSRDEPAMAAIDAFRARQTGLEICAIRGNHDRKLEALPAHWQIEWITGSLHQPPFVFAHEPAADARGYLLAGHIHPVLRLRSRVDAARLPLFWFRHSERIGVLPSFGSFTGGYPVQPAVEDTVIAVTPDGLVALQSWPSIESVPCTS